MAINGCYKDWAKYTGPMSTSKVHELIFLSQFLSSHPLNCMCCTFLLSICIVLIHVSIFYEIIYLPFLSIWLKHFNNKQRRKRTISIFIYEQSLTMLKKVWALCTHSVILPSLALSHLSEHSLIYKQTHPHTHSEIIPTNSALFPCCIKRRNNSSLNNAAPLTRLHYHI